MKDQKQSRKISILAAVFVLLAGIFIGGYLVLKSGRGAASQLDDILKGAAVEKNTCQPDANNKDKDSDNDGLKDWQEQQVYFTDPCNTDTDDDGYLDGEEVVSGYDPLKKAPGDELPGTTPKGPRPLPANLTKALSALLSQQIATGRIESFTQTGQILSPEELEKYPALQQSVQQIMSSAQPFFAPDEIDEKQIKTTNDTGREAAIKYFQDVSLSFSASESSLSENEQSQAFLNAINLNDLSAPDPQLEQYQQVYEKIKTLTVPVNLLEIHKEQLDILSQLIKSYKGVKEINNDPLRAVLAIQSLQSITGQQSGWRTKLAQLLKTSYPANK